MRCSEFLELYSDYRDGLIADPAVARSVRNHLRHCARCMSYDARVARGVMALRATGEIEPNPLFVRRLKRSVRESAALPEPVEPVRPVHAGIMVALMVCTAIATAIWARTDRTAETASAPSAAEPQTTSGARVRAPQRQLNTTEEFADWDLPVFIEQGPAEPEQAVSFETWVTSPR